MHILHQVTVSRVSFHMLLRVLEHRLLVSRRGTATMVLFKMSVLQCTFTALVHDISSLLWLHDLQSWRRSYISSWQSLVMDFIINFIATNLFLSCLLIRLRRLLKMMLLYSILRRFVYRPCRFYWSGNMDLVNSAWQLICQRVLFLVHQYNSLSFVCSSRWILRLVEIVCRR